METFVRCGMVCLEYSQSVHGWLFQQLLISCGLCCTMLGVGFTSDVEKGSPYSITECRVPELIPVLGSQPAGDVSHKRDGRLPLLSVRPAVTPRNP